MRLCWRAALIWAFIRRELYARHRKKLLSSAEKSAARLKFLLEPERLFDLIRPSDGVFVHRGTDRLSAADIADAARACGRDVTIVTAARPTETAAELIRLSGGVTLVTPEEHIGKSLCEVYPVTKEERNKAAAAELRGSRRRASFKESVLALSKERALKYFSVGAGLYLFSFFVRYAIYYRVIASISISLGAIVFAGSRLKRKER